MTEQIRCPPAVAQPALPKFVPGYLLTPFGWAAHPLAAMVAAEPQLLADLFELDRTRMHLIALALAHLDDQALPQLGPVLVRASAREILDRVLGRSPPGIKGMLRRLPYVVLSRESYRRLVRLLDQPQTAKLLHHLADREIAEAVIELLDQVPAPLRSRCSASFIGLSIYQMDCDF